MIEQFVETWRINNRANLMLLDELDERALHMNLSSRGGGTPAKQFAHIHNVRFWKLEKLAAHLAEEQEKISPKEDITQEIIRYRLIESSTAIEEVLTEGFNAQGEIDGYRRGAATLMGYFISHESHHRGNMMLTLRQCGYKLPKRITYGIWDWNKI